MLRRTLAALLALALAVPLPALAAAGCPMQQFGIRTIACHCHPPAEAAPSHDCCPPEAKAAADLVAAPTAATADCDCALRADAGRQPTATEAIPVSIAPFSPAVQFLAASVSTPQTIPLPRSRAASPPGLQLTSRPLLCSWTI